MNKEEYMKIERQILSSDFYMQDFHTVSEAADYLSISIYDFQQLMDENMITFAEFIQTMRIEDIKDSLLRNPLLSNDELASRYRFESEDEFLFQFYIREECTPQVWLIKHGILLA